MENKGRKEDGLDKKKVNILSKLSIMSIMVMYLAVNFYFAQSDIDFSLITMKVEMVVLFSIVMFTLSSAAVAYILIEIKEALGERR